ncbi:hypothetical protein MmiHf6_06550 [Methanimicrococcus hongohii]|uniref:Uncharacterized protein n=1 Tax=Methanimicrococcus hongohii TaxID=3028295 RepID=A0AA97A1K7_9EURY|nr:hypothetical protein [Methanimicrococcus sp. Hf6]WNY23348.1 hypothetical protein MmiHf6_06550 [Methanimicrococcus sp. Hf6]
MTDISDSNESGKREDLSAAGKNAKSDDSKSDDKRQLNVRISAELYAKLDNHPEQKGTVVTKALEKYLSEDDSDVVSQEYVSALLKQLEIKDNQILALNRQLETKDEQITERDNTTKMHIAQVQTLINQVEKKTLELEDAKKKKWYQFW